MKKMQPINGNVLLKYAATDEKTSGGIIIPDTAKEKPKVGEVIAMAPDLSDQIAVGDQVIFKEYAGTKIDYNGEEHLLVQAEELLAKFVEVDSI